MPLSDAERQARARKRIKQAGLKRVDVRVSAKLFRKLVRHAKDANQPLNAHVAAILEDVLEREI